MYVMINYSLLHCCSKFNTTFTLFHAKTKYVTHLVVQNKKIEFVMLVLKPPLCCVKILKGKTLYTRRDGWPKLHYFSQAIEVKLLKTLIEVPLSMWSLTY